MQSGRTIPRLQLPAEATASPKRAPFVLRVLAIATILALPCTSAFALDAWFPLNLTLMLVTAAVMMLFFPFRLRLDFDREDLILLLAIGCGFVGLIFAPEYGSRTLNHSLAIVSCVSVYYFFTKANLLTLLSWNTLINTIAVMTFLSACFLIAEFTMANFLSIQMRDIVPYIEIRLSDAAYSESTMMGQWIRPRGLAIEAGHMATIFELGLPFSAIAFRNRAKVFRLFIFTVSICGFCLMASAAATTSLIIASVIVALRQGMMSKVRWAIASMFVVFAIVFFSSEKAQEYVNDLIFAKALGFVGLAKDENMSAFDRSQRARVAIDLAGDFPLGFGWGTGPHLGSTNSYLLKDVPFGFISLYAEFLVAGGWFSVFLLVVFFIRRMVRTAAVRTPDTEMILLGMISLSIHYITISNYWFPVLWVSFGLITAFERGHRIQIPQRQAPPFRSI